ncbi:MAG: nuclear transport factor 2 family protein [Acidobacteria bacterium]|nr:nuclear transport factor 2 family protein [Acidobacteriota bacterium]
MADGSKMNLEARWASVWERRGGTWLIVHEHFSALLPEPATPNPPQP